MHSGPGHGAKLDRRKELAIAALLQEPTLGQAARAAGVGPATLWRWMQLPDFREAYRAVRQEAVSRAVARLQGASGAAADALVEVASGTAQPPARVAAARVIFDIAFRGLEVEELEQRIARLEAARERTAQ